MVIEIALHDSYGMMNFTEDMINATKDKGNLIDQRIALAGYIKTHHSEIVDRDDLTEYELIEILKAYGIVKYLGKYWTYDKTYRHLDSITVIEVDTSTPWMIEDYDGMESVRHIKVVNKKYNLYYTG